MNDFQGSRSRRPCSSAARLVAAPPSRPPSARHAGKRSRSGRSKAEPAPDRPADAAEESAAIMPLLTGGAGRGLGGGDAAPRRRGGGAPSPDDKYFVAQLILNSPAAPVTRRPGAGGRSDGRERRRAARAVPAAARRAGRSHPRHNWAAAETALIRLVELDPNNTDAGSAARRGQDPAQEDAEALALFSAPSQLARPPARRCPRTIYSTALADRLSRPADPQRGRAERERLLRRLSDAGELAHRPGRLSRSSRADEALDARPPAADARRRSAGRARRICRLRRAR